jgi:hypothetical protein
MLVMPDAAMKIAAEKYAHRAGHGDAVVIGMVTGLAPFTWSAIKNPSSPARASAGSLRIAKLH